MGEDLCSIIIPTYKGSSTIILAIESALSQTNINAEVVVVDDNGLGTKEQLDTQSNLQILINQNKIKYYCHEKNRNGSAARNTGLEHATGNYISFLDDDDYLMPDKSCKQVEALKNHPDCGMCICSGCYVNLNGVGYRKILRDSTNMLLDYLLDKLYFNTSAIMFRKESIVSIGGFDESFRRHQDWELVTRMLSEYPACVLEDVEMIRYLEGRNNPSNFEQRISNLDHFFEKCEPYMSKKLNESQVEKVKKFRRREICQSMIRSGEFRQAFEYGKNYGNSFEWMIATLTMFPLIIRKIIFGSKKVAPAKDELRL